MIMMNEKQQPIYRRIKEDILAQINSDQLRVGYCLPSERDMCDSYKASRTTVRLAINELETEGYIFRIQGKGTFVANRKFEQPLMSITGFSDDMRRRGREPGSKVIEKDICKADKVLAGKMDVPLGSRLIHIRRLRLADGEPIALETSYLNYDICQKVLEKDLTNASLYDFLKHDLRLILRKGKQYMEATLTDEEQSKLLSVPEKSPVLAIERHISEGNGRPIEIVYSVYRGDKFRFYVELEGDA